MNWCRCVACIAWRQCPRRCPYNSYECTHSSVSNHCRDAADTAALAAYLRHAVQYHKNGTVPQELITLLSTGLTCPTISNNVCGIPVSVTKVWLLPHRLPSSCMCSLQLVHSMKVKLAGGKHKQCCLCRCSHATVPVHIAADWRPGVHAKLRWRGDDDSWRRHAHPHLLPNDWQSDQRYNCGGRPKQQHFKCISCTFCNHVQCADIWLGTHGIYYCISGDWDNYDKGCDQLQRRGEALMLVWDLATTTAESAGGPVVAAAPWKQSVAAHVVGRNSDDIIAFPAVLGRTRTIVKVV